MCLQSLEVDSDVQSCRKSQLASSYSTLKSRRRWVWMTSPHTVLSGYQASITRLAIILDLVQAGLVHMFHGLTQNLTEGNRGGWLRETEEDD